MKEGLGLRFGLSASQPTLMIYREGLALSLDKGDTAIRDRVIFMPPDRIRQEMDRFRE